MNEELKSLETLYQARVDSKTEHLVRSCKYLMSDLDVAIQKIEEVGIESATINSCGLVQGRGREIDDLCKEISTLLDVVNNLKSMQ